MELCPDLTNSSLNASTTTEKCFIDLKLIVQQRPNSIARTRIKQLMFSEQQTSLMCTISSWLTVCNPASARTPFFVGFCSGWVSPCCIKMYSVFREMSGLSSTTEHCCTWTWFALNQTSASQGDQPEHWHSATLTRVTSAVMVFL